MENTIAVIGGGSWATALVKIVSKEHHKVWWWMRDEDSVAHIKEKGFNPNYLRDVKINLDVVTPTTNLKKAIRHANNIVIATPSAFIENTFAELSAEDFKQKKIISGVKGMLPNLHVSVTEWLCNHFQFPEEDIAFIAGPCHAEEVALKKQSYLTIAATNLDTAAHFAELLHRRFIKTTPLQDLHGAEYAAVMKNIVSLACGITHGLNYGDNFQAVMVANAMQEIKRFIDAIDPRPRDICASAYLGDLLVTAYSPLSRNRTFGNYIARNYTPSKIQMEMNMVAEGYYAVKSIYEINQKHGVDMPITSAAYRILYEDKNAKLEMKDLEGRLV